MIGAGPRRTLAWVAGLYALGVLSAHAGLIRNAQWQSDDYFVFWHNRTFGLRGFWATFAGWSPRPVSFALLELYYLGHSLSDRLLLQGFLAVLWSASMGVVLAVAAWTTGQGRQAGQRRGCCDTAPLALTLLAMFLLLGPPGEMFYSAFPAAAYLTSACGALVVLLLLALRPGAPGDRGNRRWSVVALVLTAWCSELGATFVLIYAAVLCSAEFAMQRELRIGRIAQASVGWALAAAAASAVLLPSISDG